MGNCFRMSMNWIRKTIKVPLEANAVLLLKLNANDDYEAYYQEGNGKVQPVKLGSFRKQEIILLFCRRGRE